jgi:hypothetical protein
LLEGLVTSYTGRVADALAPVLVWRDGDCHSGPDLLVTH